MASYYLKQNDTGVPLETVLSDAAGVAYNLTGATVRFLARLRGATGMPQIARACVVLDATTGRVQYVPESTDVAQPGTFDCEWQITLSGGRQATCPNDGHDTLTITPELGS